MEGAILPTLATWHNKQRTGTRFQQQAGRFVDDVWRTATGPTIFDEKTRDELTTPGQCSLEQWEVYTLSQLR